MFFLCFCATPSGSRGGGGGAPIRRRLVCNETTRGYYFVCLHRRQKLKKSIPLSAKFFRPPAVTTSGSYFNKTTYYFVWFLFHPYGVLLLCISVTEVYTPACILTSLRDYYFHYHTGVYTTTVFLQSYMQLSHIDTKYMSFRSTFCKTK